MCISSCLRQDKPNPFASEGFCRRRFSGGLSAELSPDCQRPAAVMSAGWVAVFPPRIRRSVWRNCRVISGQLPGDCSIVSRHSSGKCPGSFRRNADEHPSVSPAQLPDSLPSHSRLMPVTDPNLIRQAAAQFEPRRRPRFQNLQACRDVIIELREKGASCEAIAELLTRYGVKTSRTMVNEFVRTLSQSKGGRRRKLQLNPVTSPVAPQSSAPSAFSSQARTLVPEPSASAPMKTRGPHIAKVELLKPGEQYD